MQFNLERCIFSMSKLFPREIEMQAAFDKGNVVCHLELEYRYFIFNFKYIDLECNIFNKI